MDNTTTEGSGNKNYTDSLARAITDFPVHKLVMIVIIAGYALIAFGGNIKEWDDFFRYASIVGMAFVASIIIHFIEQNSSKPAYASSASDESNYNTDTQSQI